MTDLLIIGGSDAGTSAALRAIEIDPQMRPTLIVADRYPNFSICGLPFFLSGKVKRWQDLAHRTREDLQHRGINLLLAYQVTAIHPEERFITVEDSQDRLLQLNYDKLIIATGASAKPPSIQGLDEKGVFTLRWMDDSLALNTYLNEHTPRDIVIIGAGCTGIEMAYAMTRRGLAVTVVEVAASVLTTLDPDYGALVQKELEKHNVRVQTGIQVCAIERRGTRLHISDGAGFEKAADMVLVAAGSLPQTGIAKNCGIKTGLQGAICVTRKMETSLPNILAAGDCVEAWHQLLAANTYRPLGTVAHKQGRVAGENAAGGNCEFIGTLGTQVVKVFDLVAARTGLNTVQASAAGFDAFEADCEAWDHNPYYPGATRMKIHLTGDRTTRHLLGAQIIGAYNADISKRIDVLATAIHNEMTVDALNDLDLSYTPPLNSPWDPVQIAAQTWLAARDNGKQLSSITLDRTALPLQATAPPFFKTTVKKRGNHPGRQNEGN